jgi:NAD(P)-dependent dehydrogenase (short-subunit alcohol dehydrogenase family)
MPPRRALAFGAREASMHFSDKVALVAGGTGALGRAVALAFLEAGARVAVTSRRPAEFELLAVAAGGSRPRLSSSAADVADAGQAAKLVEDLVAAEGRLDVLVNAVGGFAGGASLWQTDPETYQRMLALNLHAGFALARAVLPQMIRQNRGWIVEVASKAAFDPAAGAAAYAASKAGAVALFASLAAEVKGHRISVNTVVPSVFDTAANRRAMPSADFSRWPTPEEIARVILFLCSDDARVIHGAAIPVYGRS